MVAAMVFPARYDYLSRIGALSPMPINARLNVADPNAFRHGSFSASFSD
jgi:hypothetical protein